MTKPEFRTKYKSLRSQLSINEVEKLIVRFEKELKEQLELFYSGK